MSKIADRITPNMRTPGSGSSSDFDAKMFQNANVSIDSPKKANDNIAKGAIEANKNLIAYNDFRGKFLRKYKFDGAQSYWNEYLNDNPIFDQAKEKEGTYALNPNRMSPEEYFNSRKALGNETAPLQNNELEASKEQILGPTGNPANPTEENIWEPRSKKEYDEIPPGEKYFNIHTNQVQIKK